MKAPDKIYILPTEMVRYYFTEERIQPAISYIRKDALLEWVEERISVMDNLSFYALKNKLNSM